MCHRYTKGRRDVDAFARLVLSLLCAHKRGKHPKVCSRSSPSHSLPSLYLGKDWASGIY